MPSITPTSCEPPQGRSTGKDHPYGYQDAMYRNAKRAEEQDRSISAFFGRRQQREYIRWCDDYLAACSTEPGNLGTLRPNSLF